MKSSRPSGQAEWGEVYRATDTHLDRHVAIKVLPGSFALDADLVARTRHFFAQLRADGERVHLLP
jgi:hypothetical protein